MVKVASCLVFSKGELDVIMSGCNIVVRRDMQGLFLHRDKVFCCGLRSGPWSLLVPPIVLRLQVRHDGRLINILNYNIPVSQWIHRVYILALYRWFRVGRCRRSQMG